MTQMASELGSYAAAVQERIAQLEADNIIGRIWEKDHTVWQDDPTEITNRLGWLDIADRMKENFDEINDLVSAVKEAGYTDVLLMGMGGSSLAPELFSLVFGPDLDGLRLNVLDSTDPGYVTHYDEMLDPARTLFIVSTKSGGTVETLSFFKYFYNRTVDVVGAEEAGDHFVGITDPGSKLLKLGHKHDFRHIFVNDPDIGGRYSVLSYFGLVPAALVGVDLETLTDRAVAAADDSDTAATLGTLMGELARHGRDKVTFATSERLSSFGDWAEQLIAESMGKDGKGILPVVGEPLEGPAAYGDDRLFVGLTLADDDTHTAELNALSAAGHPVVRFTLDDVYDVGAHFWLWEMATAVAGHIIEVQPFNQPNVESAKVSARKMVDAYHETGELPEGEALLPTKENVEAFILKAEEGDYISIHAYVNPTEENKAAFGRLQHVLRDRTRLAVTFGFGPRFLHSTGQLHKGDAGNGLFMQFVADHEEDADIPDTAGEEESSMSFGVLEQAQALGDAQALIDEDRRLVRFRITGDVADTVKRMI